MQKRRLTCRMDSSAPSHNWFTTSKTETTVRLAPAWLLPAAAVHDRLHPRIACRTGSSARARGKKPEHNFPSGIDAACRADVSPGALHPSPRGSAPALRSGRGRDQGRGCASSRPTLPQWLRQLACFSAANAGESSAGTRGSSDPQQAWLALNKNIGDFLEAVPETQKLRVRTEDILRRSRRRPRLDHRLACHPVRRRSNRRDETSRALAIRAIGSRRRALRRRRGVPAQPSLPEAPAGRMISMPRFRGGTIVGDFRRKCGRSHGRSDTTDALFRFVYRAFVKRSLVAVSRRIDRMRGQLAFHRARAAFFQLIQASLFSELVGDKAPCTIGVLTAFRIDRAVRARLGVMWMRGQLCQPAGLAR